MYEKHVLDHYRNPRRKGRIADWSGICTGTSTSDVCGDNVEIQAWLANGVIYEILWQGEGCCFSQAAASMLTEYAFGKHIGEMKEFTESDMLELFKAKCPENRKGCVLVAWNALKTILSNS